MDAILENLMIERIASHFAPSPRKVGRIHEADAEIIALGDSYDCHLAITTDTVVEEIASGLYDDPYLIGWMAATVNFSDLAAVGADPLGLLVSANYPFDKDASFIDQLAEGIADACRAANTYVLGGDTNEGQSLFVSGTAVGLVPKERLLTRIGARPGDRCYLSGPAGLGSIYAFLRLTGQGGGLGQSFYQPAARIGEGRLVRRLANCCMDTSDGVIHTLDTLMRLNQCQFVLYDRWGQILHPAALEACRSQGIPDWITLAGVHGEFELCFTLGREVEEAFLCEARKLGWNPILIGEVKEGWGVWISTDQRLIQVDTARIRNLSRIAGSSHEAYIHELLSLGRQLGV